MEVAKPRSNPFVTSDEALLLDLICTRYPGTKPSDYFPELDEGTAFSLDSALAIRGRLIDRDIIQIDLIGIHESINNVCRTLGNKNVKPIKYVPKMLGKTEEQPKELTIQEAIQKLGGKGVVIERKSNG